MQTKVTFHIIPKLTNGGAENVLLRIVKEFDLSKLDNDVVKVFEESKRHYESLDKFATIVDWKTNPEGVEKIILQNRKAPIIAWMYPAIFLVHKLKFRLKTEHPHFLEHSTF